MRLTTATSVFFLLTLTSQAVFAGEPSVGQVAELGRLVEACKADAKTAEACLKALRMATTTTADRGEVRASTAVTDTFRVEVRCDLSESVEAGKYDWVSDYITRESFPAPDGCADGQAEVAIFHFGRAVSSEEAIAEMDRAGYRPANWAELLALGAGHPNLQREFPLIALGSRWRSPHGRLDVPFLYELVGKRYLRLRWFGHDWNSSYRFVAVRK